MFPYMQSRAISKNAPNACMSAFTIQRAGDYHKSRESPVLICSAPMRPATTPRPAPARLEPPLGLRASGCAAISQPVRTCRIAPSETPLPIDLAATLHATAMNPRFASTLTAPPKAAAPSLAICARMLQPACSATAPHHTRGCEGRRKRRGRRRRRERRGAPIVGHGRALG